MVLVGFRPFDSEYLLDNAIHTDWTLNRSRLGCISIIRRWWTWRLMVCSCTSPMILCVPSITSLLRKKLWWFISVTQADIPAKNSSLQRWILRIDSYIQHSWLCRRFVCQSTVWQHAHFQRGLISAGMILCTAWGSEPEYSWCPTRIGKTKPLCAMISARTWKMDQLVSSFQFQACQTRCNTR